MKYAGGEGRSARPLAFSKMKFISKTKTYHIQLNDNNLQAECVQFYTSVSL